MNARGWEREKGRERERERKKCSPQETWHNECERECKTKITSPYLLVTFDSAIHGADNSKWNAFCQIVEKYTPYIWCELLSRNDHDNICGVARKDTCINFAIKYFCRANEMHTHKNTHLNVIIMFRLEPNGTERNGFGTEWLRDGTEPSQNVTERHHNFQLAKLCQLETFNRNLCQPQVQMFNVIDCFHFFFLCAPCSFDVDDNNHQQQRQMNSMKSKNMLMKRECIEIYSLLMHFALNSHRHRQFGPPQAKRQKKTRRWIHLFRNYSNFWVLC